MLFTNETVSSPPKELFHSNKNEKDAQSALFTAASFFSQSRVYFLVHLHFSLLMNNLFLAFDVLSPANMHACENVLAQFCIAETPVQS